MNRIVSKSEVERLGKRGSYRLGSLGQQGIGRPVPPAPFRPSFTRTYPVGPGLAWLLAVAGATALVAGGAAAGLWFMPFVVGVAAGIAARWGGWRLRVSGPAVVVMTGGGWGIALWVLALRGRSVGGTAEMIAALAGLPANATLALAGTLAVAVLLGLAGLWLGRALTPRPRRV